MNTTMEYKGYIGSVEFSEADELFYGKVQGIKSLISYEGRNAKELISDFQGAVDDYLHENSIKNTYCYPALLTYEKGKEIAVEFPDLDVAKSGVDDEDALISARELLELTMLKLEEDRDKIPKPTPLQNIKLETNQKVILVDVLSLRDKG